MILTNTFQYAQMIHVGTERRGAGSFTNKLALDIGVVLLDR